MWENGQILIVYCKLRFLAIMANLPLEMFSVLNISKLNMDYIDEMMIDKVFWDLKIHLAEVLNEAYFDLQIILPNNYLMFLLIS